MTHVLLRKPSYIYVQRVYKTCAYSVVYVYCIRIVYYYICMCVICIYAVSERVFSCCFRLSTAQPRGLRRVRRGQQQQRAHVYRHRAQGSAPTAPVSPPRSDYVHINQLFFSLSLSIHVSSLNAHVCAYNKIAIIDFILRRVRDQTFSNILWFCLFSNAVPVSSCGRRTSPDPSSNAQCHQQQQQQDLFSRIYGVNAPTPGAYHPGPTPSSPKHPLFIRNNRELRFFTHVKTIFGNF